MTADDLRAILARLGMSQLRLATVLDVDPTTVRRWVSRKNPTPIPKTVEIIMRIADAGLVDLEEAAQAVASKRRAG